LLLLLPLLLLLLLQVFLNMQDRLLSQKGRSTWSQAYYMPTPSDSAVIAGTRCLVCCTLQTSRVWTGFSNLGFLVGRCRQQPCWSC
jgi:hypothetical protein